VSRTSRTANDDEPALDVATIHAEMAASLLVEPVTLGGDEERVWADCDLANRVGLVADPRSLH
jgi:hypothetical protein